MSLWCAGEVVVDHVRRCLGLPEEVGPDLGPGRTAKRHRSQIRARQGVVYDQGQARVIAAEAMGKAALTKNNPPDLINVALERLIEESLELPGFTTLDEMAARIRARVNAEIFARVVGRMGPDGRERIGALLTTAGPDGWSGRPPSRDGRGPRQPVSAVPPRVLTSTFSPFDILGLPPGAATPRESRLPTPRPAPRSPSCGTRARRRPGTATAPPSPPGCPGATPRSTGPRRRSRPTPNAARKASTRPARSPRRRSTGCCRAATSRCANGRYGGCSTRPQPELRRSWR
ncbi:DUF4158 domain-containing protein [Streptosporangium roseum]|uniref:DUF4158 domain-containing protein n=1 Tax=Streptosporangium roseum TaxID=2001 RepID=UPI0022AE7126|nr:DUF4158 domain-containing protein [Streptosporangium roseum]